MMYLIVGENGYQRVLAVQKITAATKLMPEKYDGATLSEAQLADCIAGATLFSTKRLVIITDLSSNKPVWDKLHDWVGRVSDDTTLVLVEAKPDKRTKTYKALVKAGTLIMAEPWTDRQVNEAVRWASERAKERGATITAAQAQQIVMRSMQASERPGAFIIDQQLVDNALQALSLLDEINDDAIAAVLPDSAAESVFELMDTALSGDTERTKALLTSLHACADPYMVQGFLVSQWAQLMALKLSGEDPATVAERIGSSPFVLRKLHKHSAALSQARAKELTELLASLDIRLKTTGMEPWVAVDRFIGALTT